MVFVLLLLLILEDVAVLYLKKNLKLNLEVVINSVI